MLTQIYLPEIRIRKNNSITLLKSDKFPNIETEGIKYTGSKAKIVPYILALIEPLNVHTILDGFSGTTRVSQAFNQAGYRVFCNDIAVWSKVFSECYLLNKKNANYYQPMIDHLNNLPGKEGWFTKHYGGYPNNGESVQKDKKKKIWQIHNTKKLDVIREEIDKISKNQIEKSVLLTSLIFALDKVDSTIGHQVSYLRKWAKRSYKTMQLEVPKISLNDKDHQVFKEDIFDLLSKLKKNEVDLAYYDPPYGSSNEKMPPSRVRYASYYHLWTTVCLNDQPEVRGAANRRTDVGDENSTSVFEDFRRDENGKYAVINAIERLIRNTKSKYIILSYSNKGRATLDEIISMLQDMGMPYKIAEINHKAHVMKSMKWTNEWADNSYKQTKEYLFLISRTGKPLK